jgi:EF hand
VEFKDMHSGLLAAGLTTKPSDQALMALDLDGDGKIDYSEYLKFVVGVGRGF